jgi:hypothetical protein
MTTVADRSAIFDRADEAITALERDWPTLSYLPSFRKQIAYLRAVEQGEESDRSRLSQINIGVIAAKDIEDRNPEIAETLYELADVARTMTFETR